MDLLARRMTFCLPILLFYLHISEVNTKGICLYLSERKVPWLTALEQCVQLDMCLADLDTPFTLEQLISKLDKDKLREYWFGLNTLNKTTFKYISNGNPVEYMPPSSKLENNGDCAYLKPHEGTYRFDSAGCNEYRRFICTHTETCQGEGTKKKMCKISEEYRAILAI